MIEKGTDKEKEMYLQYICEKGFISALYTNYEESVVHREFNFLSIAGLQEVFCKIERRRLC